jgi:hypothetical protein
MFSIGGDIFSADRAFQLAGLKMRLGSGELFEPAHHTLDQSYSTLRRRCS